MRSPLNIIFSLIIATTSSAIALAQSQPPAELERLKYFEGSWRCQQPADSSKPTGAFTWNVTRSLNDFWYLGNAESVSNEQPINTREFIGYDTASEKLVRSVVVGNGNFYNLTADDWSDDKLVWSGKITMKGVARALRQEIVRDSQNEFTVIYFIADENDNWQPIVDEACIREQQTIN